MGDNDDGGAFDAFIGLTQKKNVSQTVHFVVSKAPLLSGALDECVDADDETCQGGVAAVGAFLRYYSQGEPSLVVPFADKQSPFVQMHPLGWSVNFLVLYEIMGWRLFASTPSMLTQNSVDFKVSQRDISDMQRKELPFLLTNAMIPPSLSWYDFCVPVFFDDATGLAVLSIYNANDPMNYPQVDSAIGVLNYIARLNAGAGCTSSKPRLMDSYFNKTTTTASPSDRHCWIPVIIYSDIQENFDVFLNAVVDHENPPALVIDLESNGDGDPQRVGPNGVWVINYSLDDSTYFHHKITLDKTRSHIENVQVIVDDLIAFNTSDTLKDDEYRANILALHKLADEANANDPVVGSTSTPMPATRVDDYRRCKAGECEIGNLFMDAARWKVEADVGFSTSGGFRGKGWPAGQVKVSNIWDSLPFPNELCKGTMNGVSLFKLFNYSINEATFEGENTENGDRLLQVSGMRIVYNTEMVGRRLVAMEVLDKDTNEYKPVDRLKLYDFVTDSYTCGAFDPYPELVGANLTSPGEVPGTVMDSSLMQDVVADYFRQLTTPYDCGIEGRLVNNTAATVPLNLIQTSDDCLAGTYWKEEVSSCEACPQNLNVAFLSESVEFGGITGSDAHVMSNISMVNTELFNITFIPKTKPAWLSYSAAVLGSTGMSITVADGVSNTLSSGERLTIILDVVPGQLEAGTAQGTVSFGLLSGLNYPGCPGEDRSFEVITRVSPEPTFNYLGSIRYLGWALASVVLVTSLAFIGWVLYKRTLRIVKTMQPNFLVMISCGVLIMALAIVPLSIDDEVASVKGCDIACMSVPWLLSMGFTIAMSSLFSKLWRINKLFQNNMKRGLRVGEKDVMLPFAILFTLNFAFLLVWTLVSPLKWTRIEINDEAWNTVGTCRSSADGNDAVSITMKALVGAINMFALFVAFYQAYRARNISDEFSESKYMAIALFSWVQIMIVGFPVLLLIGVDNSEARYLLEVLLIFAISMSMLLLIFGPIIVQTYFGAAKVPEGNRRSNFLSSFSVRNMGQTKISGLYDSSAHDHSESPSVRYSGNSPFLESHVEVDDEDEDEDDANDDTGLDSCKEASIPSSKHGDDFDRHCAKFLTRTQGGESDNQLADNKEADGNLSGSLYGKDLRQRCEDVLKNSLAVEGDGSKELPNDSLDH